MARIRTIKPQMFRDDRFIDLSSDTVRLFFVALLTVVDDEGRAPYAPREIRREIFPDRVELDAAPILNELDRIGLVVLYEVDGKRYLAIRNFTKHQRIDRKTPSKLPTPPTSTQDDPQLDEPSASPRGLLD